MFDKNNSVPYDKRNPNFIYGAAQAIVAVSLLILCFIGTLSYPSVKLDRIKISFSVTVGCLILHQRYIKRYARYLDLANDVSSTFDQNEPCANANGVCSGNPNSRATCGANKRCGSLPTINEGCCEEGAQSPVVDIEDLIDRKEGDTKDRSGGG